MRSMKAPKTEETGPAVEIRPNLPVPVDAFRQVANHLGLDLLIGNIEVSTFDEVINVLIKVANRELQAELTQLKLFVKRILVNAG